MSANEKGRTAWNGAPPKKKIRNRLKSEILDLASKHPEGIALVAHSLGSVIAYDVLAEAVCDKKPLPVNQLITFGSPLAWTFDLRGEDYVPLHSPLPTSRFPTAENRKLALPKGKSQLGSHTAYWKDVTFAAEVKKLIEV